MTLGRVAVPSGRRSSKDRPTRSSSSTLTAEREKGTKTPGGSSCSSSGGSAGGGEHTSQRQSLGSMEGYSPSFRRSPSASPPPVHPNSINPHAIHHHQARRGSITSRRGSGCSRVSSLTRDSSVHSLDPLTIEISDLTHIFGRTTEQELLQSAFVRVLKQEPSGDRKKELIVVHGKSGTGKTALVLDFKDAVSSTGTGYFCSGKFERYQTIASPYSGIVQALDNLCEAISVGQDKDQQRTSLFQNLGHGKLQDFMRLLPRLKSLLYGNAHIVKNDEEDEIAKNHDPWLNRSHELPGAFREFLQALCNPAHPIILFLDDLHWADEGSLDYIASLLRDRSLINLMVVGVYRDDEPVEIFFFSEDHCHTRTDIELQNLPLKSVDEILSDLTGSAGVKELAKIVLEKTHGNPFSIFQFLEMLQRKELLVFSFHTHKWMWDVDDIRSKTEVTPNVGHSLVDNVNNLSREARKLLTLAAVLGFSFDPKTLELIAVHLELLEDEYRGHLRDTVKGVVQDAVSGGLIHPDQTHLVMASQMELVEEGSDTSLRRSFYEEVLQAAIQEAEVEGLIGKAVSRFKYKFSHDLVHKTFYENTTLDIERHKLHLQIGRILRSFYTVRPEDDLLFAAVDHLNKGSHFLDSDDERLDLIEMNQKSSEKARAKSSLFSAANFSSKAIDLLKFEHDWMNHYDLLLHVYNDAAELNFACGRFDLSLRRCLEIHRHARNLRDKLPASYIRVEVLNSQRKTTEAINFCLGVLKSLGESFDRKPSSLQIISEWRKTRKMMKGRSNESLLSLPPMENFIKRQTQRYMSLLVYMTFNMINDQLLPIVVMRMLQISLQDGSCDYTPFSFAGYGMLCTVFGTFDEAFEYGEVALQFCEQLDSDTCIPGTYAIVYSILDHMRNPIFHGIEPLLKASRIGVGNGEVQYASSCAAASAAMGFHCALPLKSYIKDLKNACDQLKLSKQESTLSIVVPYWQAALNLSGGGTPEERQSAENAFKILSADNPNTPDGQVGLIWRNYHFMAYAVFYMFNNFERADLSRKEMTTKSKVGPKCLHFIVNLELFFSGLLDFALFRSKGSWAALRRGRGATKKMQKLVKAGAVNCHGMELLLRAEMESFGRKFELTKRLYDDSMRAFGVGGFIHFNAIANERAADYMQKMKKPRSLWEAYLRVATQLFAEWGAAAKVNQLVEVYRMPARYSLGNTPCPIITIKGEQARRFTPIEGHTNEEDFMSSDFISSNLLT